MPLNQEDSTDGSARMDVTPVQPPVPENEFTVPNLSGTLEPAPETLGPWRLMQLLGRGGMGEVWRAERCDGAFAMSAAIKLLRSDRANVANRFKRERQLLAELDHPRIARLIDGGVTPPTRQNPSGLPYLVTEYIDGEQLEVWCEKHRANLPQCLTLMLQICDAVSYAHSELVVHRDLKPGNILVDELGFAHLLDFGIAKLLDPEHDDERTDESPHTPEFAAPEQVQNLAITVRTDVYALGLILYALLTGQRPQKRLPNMAEQLENIISRVPPPASSVQSPALALRIPADLLRGDLDAIIAKAIAKLPQDRYASAADMASDLRRFNAGAPISARSAHWGERLSRFVARHSVRLALGGLGFTIILSAAGVALWKAAQTSIRQDLIQQRTQESKAINRFISALVSDLRVQGESSALLEQARVYAKIELADYPELDAALNLEISNAYRSLNKPIERLATLDELMLRLSKTGANSKGAIAATHCARALALAENGSLASARALLQTTKSMPEDSDLATIECGLSGGRALRRLGEPERAILLLQAGLAKVRAKTEPELAIEFTSAIGGSLIDAARFQEADGVLRALVQQFVEQNRTQSNLYQGALLNLGIASLHLAQLPQARDLVQRSIDLQRQRGERWQNLKHECVLARITHLQGDSTAAMAALRAIVSSPRFTELPITSQLDCWRDSAEVAIATQNLPMLKQAAAAHAKASAVFDPSSAIAHYQRLLDAEVLLLSGDTAAANSAFTALAQLPVAREHSSLDPIRQLAQRRLDKQNQ